MICHVGSKVEKYTPENAQDDSAVLENTSIYILDKTSEINYFNTLIDINTRSVLV